MALFGLFFGLTCVIKPGKGISTPNPRTARLFFGDIEGPSFRWKVRAVGLIMALGFARDL